MATGEITPDEAVVIASVLELKRKALETLEVRTGPLDDRERCIIETRRLAEDPSTLGNLSDEFGVSRERIRQIEMRAFEKVQKAVKNRVAATETPAPLPLH